MSLDNIQLPASAIQDLSSKSLVALKSEKGMAPAAGEMNMLGKNQKGILIMVNHADAVHLPDSELELLLNILSACQLNMDEVGIINLHRYPELTYETLTADQPANTLLLFGIDPARLRLPLHFPAYQVQRFGELKLLCAAPLEKMLSDRAEKTNLWHCLQQIF